MTCVPWMSNPGGPLGVLGTNVIPVGCVGAPCQTSCADTYVKALDLGAWIAGAGAVLLFRRNKWALLLGIALIIFGLLSFAVLPAVKVTGLTGTSTLTWY